MGDQCENNLSFSNTTTPQDLDSPVQECQDTPWIGDSGNQVSEDRLSRSSVRTTLEKADECQTGLDFSSNGDNLSEKETSEDQNSTNFSQRTQEEVLPFLCINCGKSISGEQEARGCANEECKHWFHYDKRCGNFDACIECSTSITASPLETPEYVLPSQVPGEESEDEAHLQSREMNSTEGVIDIRPKFPYPISNLGQENMSAKQTSNTGNDFGEGSETENVLLPPNVPLVYDVPEASTPTTPTDVNLPNQTIDSQGVQRQRFDDGFNDTSHTSLPWWLKDLGLYMIDKEILKTHNGWLNDRIINAAQKILATQYTLVVNGFQDTKHAHIFNESKKQWEQKDPFTVQPIPWAQILFDGHNHWVCVFSTEQGIVYCLDSLPRTEIQEDSCLGLQLKAIINHLIHIIIPKIPQQPNDDDCGLFAIANLVEILEQISNCHKPLNFNHNFIVENNHNFIVEEMRPHLIRCLEDGKIKPFPKHK